MNTLREKPCGAESLNRSLSNSARSLFGEGEAAVIGLPPDFDFAHQLRESAHVRLATAFARESGWNILEPSLLQSGARLQLLTGLDFAQTEPEVLWKWLRLESERRGAEARLYFSATATFHPKVLIVKTSECTFAVVGSGNLSKGGLVSNVECALYTEDATLVKRLSIWFDEVFGAAKPITEEVIKAYSYEYSRSQLQRKQQRESQARLVEKFDELDLIAWPPPDREDGGLWTQWQDEGLGVGLDVVRHLNRILRKAVPKCEFHLTDVRRHEHDAVVYKDGVRLCDLSPSEDAQLLRLRVNKSSVTITGMIGGDDYERARAKQENALRPYFEIKAEKPESKSAAVRVQCVTAKQLRNSAAEEEMRRFFKRSLEWPARRQQRA